MVQKVRGHEKIIQASNDRAVGVRINDTGVYGRF